MSDPSEKDEVFFIGWEAKAADPIRSFLKGVSLLLLVGSLAIAGLVTALQKTVTEGRFDFGKVREFSGILLRSPTPMLIADSEVEGEKIFYLVAMLKHGFPTEVAEENHLKHVKLKGTFIGDDLEAMIEVVGGSVTPTGDADGGELPQSGGEQVTLRGEIVDSKCHLGVMNPGRFKPHRACAIQCISGGIPPILVVRTKAGELAHYLLVGADGAAINDAVLDFVSEPVEISGALRFVGDRKVLYINPQSIKRL